MDLLTYESEQQLAPISDDLTYEGLLLRPAGPQVLVRVSQPIMTQGTVLTATDPGVEPTRIVESFTDLAPLPDWFDAVASEVVDLTLLSQDWDSYGGQPVSREVAGAALTNLLRVAHKGLQQPAVVPDSEGGVSFEWESPEAELMLVIRGQNQGTFFFENLAQPDESQGTLNDLDALSEALGHF